MTDEVHFSTDVTLMTHVITGAVDSQAQAERQYPQQTLYTQTQYTNSLSLLTAAKKSYLGLFVVCLSVSCMKTLTWKTEKKTKFRLSFKLSLLRGSHPKSARASPQHLAHKVPNYIQIGSLSAEL